jgi:protease-4
MTCLVVLVVFAALCFIGFLRIVFAASSFRGGSRPIMHRGGSTVGLVRVENVIMDGSKIMETIDYYKDSDSIRAVLVRVDSPGGAVGTSQEIYEALKQLRAKGKKVVISMGNTAASGGYYVACGGQEIFCNPGTMTGSIGVIIGLPNLQEIAKKVGIQYQNVKSGRFKDIGSSMKPLSPEDRQLLQGVINDTYDQFVGAVLSQRQSQIRKAAQNIADIDTTLAATLGPNPTAEKLLRAIADGRIFTGRQALAYGLVDKLGTQSDALKRLGELAGIPKPQLYEYKPVRSWRDVLQSSAKSAIESAGVPLSGPRLEYRMPY